MPHHALLRSAIPLALAAAAALATAQPSDLLLEACNRLPDAKKRLACFKEATRQPAAVPSSVPPAPVPAAPAALAPAAVPPPVAAVTSQLPPLALADAVRMCTRLITVAQGREAEAAESAEASSPREMSVAWPALPGKQPVYCNVDRAEHRITSITSNGKVASGDVLDSMHARALQREEIQAGNYTRFLARAKEALKAQIPVPEAARYRKLFVSTGPLHVLCGEVDAGSASGAREGFQRFYVSADPQFLAVDSRKTARVFEATWASVCAHKAADITHF
jgi:hypothetical protein